MERHISHGHKEYKYSVISFLIKTTSFLPISLQTQSIEPKLHFSLDSDEIKRRLNRSDLLWSVLSTRQIKEGWSKFSSWMLIHFTFPSEYYQTEEKPTNVSHKDLYGLYGVYICSPPMEHHMSDPCTRIFYFRTTLFCSRVLFNKNKFTFQYMADSD